jgi:hypothetical protein
MQATESSTANAAARGAKLVIETSRAPRGLQHIFSIDRFGEPLALMPP